MSYQAEERYWTDYVRVATPIVGLLLLLGVFWYWASSLIGDQSGTPPETPPAVVETIAADTPTPTATVQVVLSPETAVPTSTEGPVNPTATEGEQPEETPTVLTTQPASDCQDKYQEGEIVLSKDDNVNFRAQPSTSANVVDVLTLNREMTIIDCQPVEGDGLVWWHVRDNETGAEGYVADEWLKPQE